MKKDFKKYQYQFEQKDRTTKTKASKVNIMHVIYYAESCVTTSILYMYRAIQYLAFFYTRYTLHGHVNLEECDFMFIKVNY